MRALLDNPRKAVEKLRKYKVGALFMEAGTAKTSVAYTLVKSAEPDYCLWFTPFNTKNNLRAELDKCGGLDCDIIGVESIQNSDRIYLELFNKIKNSEKSFIICDESLTIKNSTTKRTRRLIELADMCEYKLILNGTPLSKNMLDLYTQLRFLSPKILNMPESEFKNMFCEYITIDEVIGGYKSSHEYIIKYANIEYLFSLIEPFVFESRLKIDVGIQFIDLNYFLTAEELRTHKELKEKLLNTNMFVIKNNNIFLELTQKLQHNYSLSPQKIRICRELIAQHGRENVLVCVKYVDTREQLGELLDCRILSWQKDSFGLNLQSYNVIIEFDKHWDYALHEQLFHRIFRTGQKRECYYYRLNGNTGLDNMMNMNQDRKGKLLNQFKEKSISELEKML